LGEKNQLETEEYGCVSTEENAKMAADPNKGLPFLGLRHHKNDVNNSSFAI
jgi:hypothetical protein